MLARAGSLFKPDDPLELEMKTPSVPQAEGAGGAAGGAAAAGRAADNVEQPPPSVGEYSLRILLVSARDILAIDDEDTPSPFAKVSLTGLPCDDQTWEDQRKTKPKSTANCFFDSTIVFEFDLSDGKQLSMGTLTVEIWDRKLLSFDELLGSYVLDLSKLWDMREHELWRKWVGLVDVTGAAQGARGYLKLSATLVGPGGSPPFHDPAAQAAEDAAADQEEPMVPPTLAMTPYDLVVELYRAEDIPEMDRFSDCDAYGQVRRGCRDPCPCPLPTSASSSRSKCPPWEAHRRLPMHLIRTAVTVACRWSSRG
jgi:hypothetical protein